MLFQQEYFDGFMEITASRNQDVEELFGQILTILKQKMDNKTISLIETNKTLRLKEP